MRWQKNPLIKPIGTTLLQIRIFLKFLIAFRIRWRYYIEALEREHGSLAQLVEQLTLNQWVEGSSPSGTTIYKYQ